MKIEEAIKTKGFKTAEQKTMVNIIYTANWITNIHLQFFKQFKLTPQQYNVLRILRGQYPNPATVALIKDRMLDKMSDASRIVDRLQKLKLVTRKDCTEDKRKVYVIISDEALKLMEAIDKEMITVEKNINQLSAEEKEQLNFLLDKLRK